MQHIGTHYFHNSLCGGKQSALFYMDYFDTLLTGSMYYVEYGELWRSIWSTYGRETNVNLVFNVRFSKLNSRMNLEILHSLYRIHYTIPYYVDMLSYSGFNSMEVLQGG